MKKSRRFHNYTPSHIANFFLSEENHSIDNLKLNKIVYISVGYCLVALNDGLFEEEIQAWRYGPVIPSLYYEFRPYGKARIDTKSNLFIADEKEQFPMVDEGSNVHRILGIVKNIYQTKAGNNLIKLTHQKDTPWSFFYVPNANKIIKKEIIKGYYKAIFGIE